MSFKEIMELKNEILKNNRELEIRLKNQIDNYSKEFSNNISSFQKKINVIDENNNKVMNSIPNMNFNISKITQLERFDQRIDNRLSSHDLRITTILTEIEKIKTKYDKIVLDNLYVPGHVGGRSQFPNLSQYLLFNINEVSLLKAEKEQLKRDTNNMRNKHDNTIKQVVNLIDGSVKRCNEYTDNKQKDFQLLLDTKMREFNEKVMEIRMNVCKIQMKTEEDYNNLKEEFNKLLEENKEFTNFFQNKLMVVQDDLSELQKNYKVNIDDVKCKNKNLGKDVKNIKYNINNLLKLVKYYQKKQKYKNNNDIYNSYNLNMSSDEKKSQKNKNKESLISQFENSQNKVINTNNSINMKNINNAQNNIKITNKNNNKNYNMDIRRRLQKRNTMFHTGSILQLQINKKPLSNKNDSDQATSPSFLGLLNPILNKIVNGPTKDGNENNKSNNNSMFSIIYSDRNKSKDKNKNNEDNTKIMDSNFSSKSESNTDSEIESENINDISDKKNIFYFPRKKKKNQILNNILVN